MINVQKGRKHVLQPPAGIQKLSLMCGTGRLWRESLNNVKCFLLDPYQILPDWKNVEVKEEPRRSARVARGRKCPQSREEKLRITAASFCVEL